MRSKILPTAQVRGILDGRVTMFREPLKPQPCTADGSDIFTFRYRPGEILYVREAWVRSNDKYYYKADQQCTHYTDDGICLPRGVEKHITCEACEYLGDIPRWRSPATMPSEAARLFLRVTDVTVERVQDANLWTVYVEFERCEKEANHEIDE